MVHSQICPPTCLDGQNSDQENPEKSANRRGNREEAGGNPDSGDQNSWQHQLTKQCRQQVWVGVMLGFFAKNGSQDEKENCSRRENCQSLQPAVERIAEEDRIHAQYCNIK